MEDYVLVLSYVFIVPLIYLNSLLKGCPRWNRPLQRNGKALQSPVEVFLIDVHPIWNTTQELMNRSRIGSRQLSLGISWSMKSSKSISRSSLLSLDGGRGTLGPVQELIIYIYIYIYICIDFVYDIV
jgi:hypothetical protein